MMANGDPERFTVKEILTQFIQPTLEEIREKLDTKADLQEVVDLKRRVEALATATSHLPDTISKVAVIEQKLTTPEQIGSMIEAGLRASKSRGWTIREKALGAAVGVMTLITLILNLLTNNHV